GGGLCGRPVCDCQRGSREASPRVTDYRVIVAARAITEIEKAASWWSGNRQSVSSLLVDELQQAFEQLSTAPRSGIAVATKLQGVRRLLLPKCKYHLYYTVDDQHRVVKVRAFWHAVRRRGPRL